MTLDSDFVKPDLNTNNQPAQKFTQEKKWIIPVPEIRRRDLYYYNLPISKYLSTTECEIEGLGKMTLFGGYSYLSLHKHPYIEQKVTEAIASLELMKQEPEQVTTLHHNVLYAKFKLKEANIETVPSETAILPIWVGNNMESFGNDEILFAKWNLSASSSFSDCA